MNSVNEQLFFGLTHQAPMLLNAGSDVKRTVSPFHPLWGDKNCRIGNSRES
jgi:hypothetical protein